MAYEEQSNVFSRLSRALRFYSIAIPVFSSYKVLEERIKFQRNVLKRKITDDDETKAYASLHEWGSQAIIEIITELKV